MNPYRQYVRELSQQVAAAKSLPLGGFPAGDMPLPAPDAPVALLFSPHPDDECITGLLPLRLMREAGMRIVNVPVTHGSRLDRQAGRHAELRAACAFLGWSVVERTQSGSLHIADPRQEAAAAEERAASLDFRSMDVEDIVTVLSEQQPEVIFFPHAEDWNECHIATHQMVMAALGAMPAAFCCTVVETEYWGAMDAPNLMVEGDVEWVADLVAATSFHKGEVERNPYHRLLPAWMMDNVRRGAERIGGQGHTAPPFDFATLYRVSRWEAGRLQPVALREPFLLCRTSAKDLVDHYTSSA